MAGTVAMFWSLPLGAFGDRSVCQKSVRKVAAEGVRVENDLWYHTVSPLGVEKRFDF